MKHCFLLLLLVGRTLAGRAQTLDPTFQPPTLLKASAQRGAVSLAVPLLNGQLVVSGDYATVNGQPVAGRLQRLQAVGLLDQDVQLPPVAVPGANYAHYGTLLPQPDGQVYATVAARFCQASCVDQMSWSTYLWRVQSNNTLDPSFAPLLFSSSFIGDSQAANLAQQVLPYPTGELLVLLRLQVGNEFRTSLLKLQASGANLTGSLPALFTPFLGQNNANTINQLVMQPDGKVVVSYQLVTSGTSTPVVRQGNLVRLLPNGALDPTFAVAPNPLLPATAAVSTLVLQPDGKLLLAGNFTAFAGVPTPDGAVRLNPDGSLDATFQPAPSLAPLVPLACLPDGRLLARANSQPGQARLRQLLGDGAMDPSFAPVAVTVAGAAVTSWNVVLQTGDNKPVLYGDFDAVAGQPRTGLARLSAATTLAARPGGGAGAALRVYPIPAQGRATLLLTAALAQASTVQLYDNLGREVRRQAAPAHVKELTLSLSGLKPGLYLLRCGTATGRLVVE